MISSIPSTNSVLQWIVAKDYYDGATTGIGFRNRDGGIVFFRAVGWDEEQWERVFALTLVSKPITERLIRELEKLEPRRLPFWLPGPASLVPATQSSWDEIQQAALLASDWQLVECHDLLEAAKEISTSSNEGQKVADLVRRAFILEVRGPALLDDFLRQIRA
jgi:hypothetical protein